MFLFAALQVLFEMLGHDLVGLRQALGVVDSLFQNVCCGFFKRVLFEFGGERCGCFDVHVGIELVGCLVG